MKKWQWLGAGFLIIILFLAGCNQEAETEVVEGDEELIQLTETFMERLNEEKYEEIVESFNETMKDQLTAAELKTIWDDITNQAGSMIDYEYDSSDENDGYEIIYMVAVFENIDVRVQVAFDDEQKIAGFYIF